jgi:hypothetical protein
MGVIGAHGDRRAVEKELDAVDLIRHVYILSKPHPDCE